MATLPGAAGPLEPLLRAPVIAGSAAPSIAVIGPIAPAGPRPARGGTLGRLMREPLTHFVALGLAIVAAHHAVDERQQRYTIELGSQRLRQIADAYAGQYGVPPSPSELKALTDDYVRQEVLVREGLAMGLERDDEIVRRRIAQKVQFLLDDRASPRAPTETELHAWFAAHRQRYAVPARRSFDQRFFAVDRRGDDAARRLASAALAGLRQGRAAGSGDPFPGPAVVRLLSQDDADRLFGGSLAAQAFAAPRGQWSGPFRSAFGWHLVRVTETATARPRRYAEARIEAAAEWRRAQAEAANAAAYARLRARYRIVGQEAGR